jgi:hypothetical protein
MNTTKFRVRVVSVHPSFDSKGNEYICIEFGFRPPKIPTMVPSSVPKELSDAIQASRDMVKVIVPPQLQAQMSKYSNRLTLYLTPEEWENLQQKHTVGDLFEISLRQDGSMEIRKA